MGDTNKTFKQVQAALRQGWSVVPLVRELSADTVTPVAAYLRLARAKEPSFLLESVEGGERMARYSFLGFCPFETMSIRGQTAYWESDSRKSALPGMPLAALAARLKRYRAPREPGLPRFCGGAVGFAGYELAGVLEPTSGLRLDAQDQARFSIFHRVVAFDRLRHRMLLIANVICPDGKQAARAYRSACDALDEMRERLSRKFEPHLCSGAAAQRTSLSADRAIKRGNAAAGPRWEAALGETAFLEGVRRLKRHIRAGDIFQGVLSERFELSLKAEPFSVYRALRSLNPSPYMFYIDIDGQTVLGASPEMLVRVEDGRMETRPIAGTRPRGRGEKEDRRMETRLLASGKERAEHRMLVDLGRNDLGRVASPGSVRVDSLMQVERYSHVMHMVSSVTGRLKRGLSPWDAFSSCFPAGTVTGAPKIRAMQLVSEIEPKPRGLYAGAVVYCDFRGNLDSAIAIRSMLVRGSGARRRAYVQAGAGVVADSAPERELAEVRAKARAMFEAVRLAEAG